jgi:aminoglycoside-2''-adenylyltransferase
MTDSDFRDVIQAASLFAKYDRHWAVCGGWALDLFLNRVTRSHKDIDFAVLRKDQLVIQDYLLSRGWNLEKAVNGQLIRWRSGEWIDLPVHTIWCKNPQALPDFIELLFNEVDEVNFLFRRDFSVTLPLKKMIVLSAAGIPILAPEIVLLYKSADTNESNSADFENVLPNLSLERRVWLATALQRTNPNHEWVKDLL